MHPTKGVLAIADESLAGDVLFEAIRTGRERIGADTVTIVAPEPWTYRAELRLAETVALLAAHDIDAEAWVGDPDPVLAVQDARDLVPVDLLVVGAPGLAERLVSELQLPALLVTRVGDADLVRVA